MKGLVAKAIDSLLQPAVILLGNNENSAGTGHNKHAPEKASRWRHWWFVWEGKNKM